MRIAVTSYVEVTAQQREELFQQELLALATLPEENISRGDTMWVPLGATLGKKRYGLQREEQKQINRRKQRNAIIRAARKLYHLRYEVTFEGTAKKRRKKKGK